MLERPVAGDQLYVSAAPAEPVSLKSGLAEELVLTVVAAAAAAAVTLSALYVIVLWYDVVVLY